jgi:two-component system sensor histidine kinase MtrB
MFGSFRTRLIATVFALIAVTAGAVGAVSYVLVKDSLRDQLVSDAVARAEFNINVLATADQLSAGAGRQEFETSGLADRFLLRGTGGLYAEFPDGETFASSLGLLAVGDMLSGQLRDIVARGEFGYEFLEIDDTPTLVVAGRRPPGGPDFFFLDSAEDITAAIDQLARVLLIAGLGVLILGALAAGLIARRVLRPVAVASQAATAMAGGDLTVRVPAETNDELGSLAVAFNQMATALEDQIGALVEAHDRERRFVADVSHELRTPLTALVNEAAMLQGRLSSLPDSDQRIGELLVADVARLRTLVEDLLEVSRLEAGSAAPEFVDVDPVRFLEAVIADRHPATRLDVRAPVPSVRADRRSLERIVGNLLDNAKNHAENAAVTMTVGVDADTLAVSVADQGPGVEPAQLPHLFDRFYKTDASRQGGSGLGLAIARQHARRLGGDLTARQLDPQGLVFDLELPVTVLLQAGDSAEMSQLQAEGEETDLTRREP